MSVKRLNRHSIISILLPNVLISYDNPKYTYIYAEIEGESMFYSVYITTTIESFSYKTLGERMLSV